MRIEPLDAVEGPEADVRALAELVEQIDQEALPGEPVDPASWRFRELRTPLSFQPVRHWVARTDDGRIAGYSLLLHECRGDNERLAFVDVAVREEHRRRHLACQLLVPLLEAAADAGRTLLCFSVPEGGPGSGFLAALGATRKLVERHSVLRIDQVDRALLEGWVARAAERASDYSLVGWEGPPPADLLEPFAALTNVMNTAPMDDFEHADFVNTAEMVREANDARVARGSIVRTLAARHDPTGALVGYTEIERLVDMPGRAWQGDTGVDPDHRNRGIGRWLKAAMLLEVMDEHPEIRRIETENAGSNDAMLGINVAMGFEVLKWQAEWQVELADLAAAVQGRLAVPA